MNFNNKKIMTTNKFVGVSDGKILQWCPTLNLLMVSMNNMSIWVYRLNGERIYSINNKLQIHSMSFTNNGLFFCLSGKDGSVKMYDSNTGKIIKVFEERFEGIKITNWSYHIDNFKSNFDDLLNVEMIHQMPTLTSDSFYSDQKNKYKLVSIDELKNQDKLNFLVMFYNEGISLNFNNLLTITKISTDIGDCKFIEHLKNNDLFNQIFLIYDPSVSLFKIVQMKSNLNCQNKKFFFQLTLKFCKINALNESIENLLNFLRNESKAFFNLFDRHLMNLTDCLINGNENDYTVSELQTKVTNYFYDLLLTNLIPESSKEFWSSQFGEKGLKRLNEIGNKTYDFIRKKLFYESIASAERLVILLSEIKGIIMWLEMTENEAKFGIKSEDVEDLLQKLKQILKIFFKIIWDMNLEQDYFNVFTKWMKNQIIDKIAKEDDLNSYMVLNSFQNFKILDVLKYINESLFQTKLFDYFDLKLESNKIFLQSQEVQFDIIEMFETFKLKIEENLISHFKSFYKSNIVFNISSLSLKCFKSDSDLQIRNLNDQEALIILKKDLTLYFLKISVSNLEEIDLKTVQMDSKIINFSFDNKNNLILLLNKNNLFTVQMYSLNSIFDNPLNELKQSDLNDMKCLLNHNQIDLPNPQKLAINDSDSLKMGCILDENKQCYTVFSF